MNYQFAERELFKTEAPRPSRQPVQAARCPQPASIELSRFPRHTFNVAVLPPAERAKIHQAALLVVQSFSAGCPAPFQRVVIGGHADRDMQRGPAFEMQISRQRAETVRAALHKEVLVLSRARGVAPPVMSAWVTEGFGATQLRVPNPRNEAARLLNRRVEIQLMAGTPTPPFPPTPPSPPSNDLFRQCLQRCAERRRQCLAQTDPEARNLCLGLLEDFCRTCARAGVGR
jgi:outer membrane protein OmpA-like peptidoglycan-associated protein